MMQIKGQTKSKGIFGRSIIIERIAEIPTTKLPAIEKRAFELEKKALALKELMKRSNRFSQSCKANILIFAKGTTETGNMGITVGPVLQAQLAGPSWSIQGVDYPANFDGNYCAGLPGGMAGKELLESAAQKCPNAKIFLSGYSQGAMSVRNALAYAQDEVKPRVKVSSNPSYVLVKRC